MSGPQGDNEKLDGFWQQIEIFSGVKAVRDTGMDRYTNLTGLYSQLAKRVYRQSGDKKIIYREHKIDGGEAIPFSIAPAIIPTEREENGIQIRSEEVRYPSVMEDRAEEALVWIASQGGARIRPDSKVIGIYFTLQQLRSAIKEIFSVTYSLAQIKTSLKILSRSSLEIEFRNNGLKTSNVNTRISNLTLVSRDEFLAVKDSRCYCELHWAFAQDIATGNYCIHDLKWQGRLKSDLAQDLMRRLSYFYRHANNQNYYHFMAKQALGNSSLGFYDKNPSKSWKMLTEALEDLERVGIISSFKEDPRYLEGSAGRKKVSDKLIMIWPSQDFIKDAKFTNWVSSKGDNSESISNETFDLVDVEGNEIKW